MSDLEGVMLSEYLLLQCVSKGGVADVYLAHQGTGNTGSVDRVGMVGEHKERGERRERQSSYEVAVKVFRPSYAQRASFRDYFMAEAEKIGQFDHPNILPFLEYGEGEDLLYLVTPFVATGTLDDLLRRVGGRFSAMQALPIVQQLCSAVQYAHDHDVIHGNIKPSNIFVTNDGRILLSDFGIAHGYDDSQQSLTRVGWGSAEYVAPEQSLGILRRASDIYSLGVLLFRILTGSTPFTGQTPVEVLLKHVRQQAPSVRSLVPTISDTVDDVLRIALQKRSGDRFASAEELAHAFQAAVDVAPVASPISRPTVSTPLQSAPIQLPAMGNLHTPLPLSVYQSGNDPQTPISSHLISDQSVQGESVSALQVDFSSATEPKVQSNQLVPPTPSTFDLRETAVSDVPEVLGKLLQEKPGREMHRLWSVDPAEWSPIAQNPSEYEAIPLTVDTYLQNKPLILESPKAAKQEKQQEREDKTVNWKKVLPLIVVILLIIGLLGAIVSVFFFPTDKSGANIEHSRVALALFLPSIR